MNNTNQETHPGHLALRRGRYSSVGHAYLVTTVTRNRFPWFIDLYLVRLLVHEMRYLDQKGRVDSLAWVVMPDHLHWLFTLEGSRPLSWVVKSLKGRSAYRINAHLGRHGSVWQSAYHDHGVRREEDLRTLARYIIANPLRAGLVQRITDYPHWDAVWIDRE